MVNNVALAQGAGLLETDDVTWQEAFAHALMPCVSVSRAAVPRLRARGGGVIVMIASIFGREVGGRMAYNTVKSAVISLAKAMSRDLAGTGIRVRSVLVSCLRGRLTNCRRLDDDRGVAAPRDTVQVSLVAAPCPRRRSNDISFTLLRRQDT